MIELTKLALVTARSPRFFFFLFVFSRGFVLGWEANRPRPRAKVDDEANS